MRSTDLIRPVLRAFAAFARLLFWGGIGLMPVLIWQLQTLLWDLCIIAAGVVLGRVTRRAAAWLQRPPRAPASDVLAEDPAWAQVSARSRAAANVASRQGSSGPSGEAR